MDNDTWLEETKLIGSKVTLIPLQRKHASALIDAAADGNLWDLWFTSVPSADTIDGYIEKALNDHSLGKALPFVVVDNSTGGIIGSTRLCEIPPENDRVEIGYTWYAKRYQKTGVNTECKYLLLQHAFEQLNVIAIELRTHWHNHVSRAAIARLGAKQDGVLRNHKKDKDGFYRDTVVFSIIDHEWPMVKHSLRYNMNR
ncbi:GNAT family N-acetyltransferase [Moritella sp. Urea-trap-13]|uniref:GNAT family N-acetyltransferase n=1 Tax=Moritella sp. Urea-trap-13 TaxID=2058327 RepID=UPI000C32FC79|nr:GNAT family protein [Moritella sp. Urea-trap-13]PKH06824.1 GNAT family N-acetyltransferase [Moritella sp. Urea-trap-13]